MSLSSIFRANATVTPVRVTALSYPEGIALQSLDALLGRSRLPREAVDLSALRPAFATVAQKHLSAAALEYLLKSGGYRDRMVLRQGRRVSGRLWDPALNKGFRLRFTAATSHLWLTAARTLPAFSTRAAAPRDTAVSETLSARKALRTLSFEPASTDVGDWIFGAMVLRFLESVPRILLESEDMDLFVMSLRAMSPLVALQTPREDLPTWGRLFAPSTVRALECMDDPLVAAWHGHAMRTWTNRTAVARMVTVQWSHLGRTLARYVEAADTAHRMDLTRSVMRALTRMVRETFAEGGEAVRTRLSAWSETRNLRERNALLDAVNSVMDVALDMERRRDRLAQERYGDERYEEAQLYLRFMGEELSPSRAAIEGITRALSSTVG